MSPDISPIPCLGSENELEKPTYASVSKTDNIFSVGCVYAGKFLIKREYGAEVEYNVPEKLILCKASGIEYPKGIILTKTNYGDAPHTMEEILDHLKKERQHLCIHAHPVTLR